PSWSACSAAGGFANGCSPDRLSALLRHLARERRQLAHLVGLQLEVDAFELRVAMRRVDAIRPGRQRPDLERAVGRGDAAAFDLLVLLEQARPKAHQRL